METRRKKITRKDVPRKQIVTTKVKLLLFLGIQKYLKLGYRVSKELKNKKHVWIKITTFFRRRVSIILWSFSS